MTDILYYIPHKNSRRIHCKSRYCGRIASDIVTIVVIIIIIIYKGDSGINSRCSIAYCVLSMPEFYSINAANFYDGN